MKRAVPILLGVLCLILPLLTTGCVDDTPAAPAGGVVSAVELANQMATKADKATVDAISVRVDSLNTRIDGIASSGGANSYPKSETYTRDEVDKLITKAITDLKTEKPWGTTTSPAGTTTGEYGQLVDSDGDLELWLAKVGGAADDEIYSTSGNGVQDRGNFTLVVLNKDTGSMHDYRITLSFVPDEDTLPSSDIHLTKANATADNGLTFSYAISVSTLFTADDALTFRSNSRDVAKGDVEGYKVNVYMTQTEDNMVDWDIEYTIKDEG